MTEVNYTHEQLVDYLTSVHATAVYRREDGAVEYCNDRMVVAIVYPSGATWIDLNA